MDLISSLQSFIRVVETGSFSAVARESHVSQSAVTRQVAQLEAHFGVRLLHRTTRKLSLTDDGQALLTRARHLLEEAAELEETFGRQRDSVSGLVRMGVPVATAMLMTPDLTELLQRHPALSVELVVNERIEDLVAERLDLAIRLGPSGGDTSLVARALATLGASAVAAPAYLERCGAPSHPSELAQHTCILLDNGPESAHWLFSGPEGHVDVEVTSSFRSNNTLAVRQAALAGYGIALLGDALTINDIRSQRLYRLMPNFVARQRQAYVVYPSRRNLPQRTRVVIDFVVERFRVLDSWLQDGRMWGESESSWLG
ncbi:LysR family transcriptional regulator [Rhodopila sp.]|uniref:LysR family transcriptional regulator n=1 Tax=Rhodopila sp. TaxID=2480087 RepID=UPI002C05B27C|nr:LysR family transcriptional regulator [Rhodopila sp.]HVZ09184.1 LysR family transcriptional regulator [Rhodopila sp.]